MGRGSSQRLFNFAEAINFESLVNAVMSSCRAALAGPPMPAPLQPAHPAEAAAPAAAGLQPALELGVLPEVPEDSDIVAGLPAAPDGDLCFLMVQGRDLAKLSAP